MATVYVAKAQFKTAYLQREVVEDFVAKATFPKTVASGDANCHVGDVFYLNSGKLQRRENSSAAAVKGDVAVGDYIIAQADMTMGAGHVPVEYQDYKYKDTVAMTADATKKFALFKITDLNDVILDTYTYTTA